MEKRASRTDAGREDISLFRGGRYDLGAANTGPTE